MILAISSSTDYYSVGLFQKNLNLLGEFSFFTRKLQKSGILAVDNLLKSVEKQVFDLTEVAVDTGPGLFTGLRIGVAMAKSIAFSQSIPLREVSSLDLIRSHIIDDSMGVIAAMDGKQGRVFAQIYHPDGRQSGIMDIEPQKLTKMIQVNNWGNFAQLGTGFLTYPELSISKNSYPIDFHYPSVRNISSYWSESKNQNEVNARYYRKTQAEEKHGIES